MITNIIKNIIKDFPTISDSHILLFCQDEEKGEFTIAPENNDNIFLVIQSKHHVSTSIEDWKKQMIADHIYMATQVEDTTFGQLSAYIDKIINSNATIWEL